jgi:endonuclease YncB( thermonuclease family)
MIDRAHSLAVSSASLWRSLRLLRGRFGVVLASLALICIASSPGNGREIESYAIVRDDGSLHIQGRTLRLFGIFIPDTGRVCRKTGLPSCGSRAALALDDLIKGRGFVRCELMGAGTAACFVRREIGLRGELDLAAALLLQGLAVASPEAPQQYRATERWARHLRVGIWGRFPPKARISLLPSPRTGTSIGIV